MAKNLKNHIDDLFYYTLRENFIDGYCSTELNINLKFVSFIELRIAIFLKK